MKHIFLLLVLTQFAHADSGNSELVEELFLNEIVYSQEKGALQLTAQFNWADKNDSTSELEESFFHPALEAEYGIMDEFQVSLELPFQFGGGEDKSGLGNTAVGALYKFYDNAENGWALSLATEVGLPRASNEVGKPGFLIEPALIAYKSFGKFALNASVGFEIPTDDSLESETEAGLGVIYAFEKFATTAELQGEFEDAENNFSLAVGAALPIEDEGELGLAIVKGLSEQAPKWQVLSMFVWEFED